MTRQNLNIRRFRERLAIVLFTLAASFPILPVSAQWNERAPEILSGELKHTERLPALKGGVKVGQELSDSQTKSFTSGRWFEIPSWLAGTWRSVQVTRLSNVDEKTGDSDTKPTNVQIRERETFGFQLDRKNSIWTCSSSVEPIVYSTSLRQTNKDGEEEIVPVVAQITRENAPANLSNDKVILKSFDSLIISRKDNRVVQSFERRELIRTITLIEPSVIAIYTDLQSYDSAGYPETRETLCEFRKKERGFQIQNEVRSVSLYSSFSKFLQTSGHLGLLPEKQ